MSSSHQEGQQGRHPTFMQYVLVAVILFVITIVEFLLIWPRAGIVESLGYSKIPVLAILSAVKFAIVIAFYMHLKFDNRLLTWVFLAGLFLGPFALVVVFLPATPREGRFVRCSSCAEVIQAKAATCRYCGMHMGTASAVS